VSPYYVEHLKRPYDFRVLIEVFIYTRRGYVHDDFTNYYKELLQTLEGLFGIRLSSEGLEFRQRIFWSHFEITVRSLLQITHPWEGYLEDSLLNIKLAECGERGQRVFEASKVIGEACKTSAAAHREMLYALFTAIFGECSRVVTSEELAAAGFDDSREPNTSDYFDYM